MGTGWLEVREAIRRQSLECCMDAYVVGINGKAGPERRAMTFAKLPRRGCVMGKVWKNVIQQHAL